MRSRHHRVPPGEQHVLGLDVPVHDAARVRVLERLGHVAQHAHGLVARHGPAAAAAWRTGGRARLALDERAS
jgi:hypothetical protein